MFDDVGRTLRSDFIIDISHVVETASFVRVKIILKSLAQS